MPHKGSKLWLAVGRLYLVFEESDPAVAGFLLGGQGGGGKESDNRDELYTLLATILALAK